jgi:hypothetical protein
LVTTHEWAPVGLHVPLLRTEQNKTKENVVSVCREKATGVTHGRGNDDLNSDGAEDGAVSARLILTTED